VINNSPTVDADSKTKAMDKKFMSRTKASEKAMKAHEKGETKSQEKMEHQKDGNTYRK
jgi:hypothetical protein